ncbi:MAG: YceI family protein [Vicinamibacteria bacterium]|nr:YceI family protein [Vicinamibacteria bacterium]
MKSLSLLFAATLAAVPALPAVAADVWTVDKTHSELGFSVRHLGVSRVRGAFNDYAVRVEADPSRPENSKVEVTIQAASIDTRNQGRDNHLKSPDFFDVATHPTITFKSTSIKAAGENLYHVTGDFTMRGVTKQLTIPVAFTGFSSMRGTDKAGFELETTINRKDYGVSWSAVLDNGGLVVSDDVKIEIALQMNKEKPAAPAAP